MNEPLEIQAYNHLKHSIKFALPIAIGGWILVGISTFIDSFGFTEQLIVNTNKFLLDAGELAVDLSLIICAGYIAESMASSQGLLIGLMAGALTVDNHSGIVGALIAGYVAGFIANKIKESTENIFINSLIGLLLISLICNLIIAPPILEVIRWFSE